MSVRERCTTWRRSDSATAASAALLEVAVRGVGQRGVRDPADVRLVDTHAERRRRDHDVDLVVAEVLVALLAHARRHAAVVDLRVVTGLAEPFGEFLGGAPG